MKIKLLAIGEKMPAWVEQAINDYAKRLPRELGFELVALPMSKRAKTKSVASYKAEEAKTFEAALSKVNRVIALDVKGKAVSTESLVTKIQQWQLNSDNVALLIGGPDGIDQSLLNKADERCVYIGYDLAAPVS